MPAASVDLVTAGQAFHWFDAPRARDEFARILRSNGFVALVWNQQDVKATPFMHGYAALLDTYALDYNIVKHSREGVDEDIALLFDGRMQVEVFPNEQCFDFEGLRGRLLSSSYAPLPDHANYQPMIAELRRLFEAHWQNGEITFKYETRLYLGKIR